MPDEIMILYVDYGDRPAPDTFRESAAARRAHDAMSPPVPDTTPVQGSGGGCA